jgi:tRNA-modifying protein YgfZ
MTHIVNCMLFDLGERTQLELTGAQRAKFLHGFCTNDIAGLSPGRGCEAFVCNIQGKTLGHIAVFCGENSLWIDSVPGQEELLFAHLDRYLINEDVQIHRRSLEYGELYLHGASSAEQLAQLGWKLADDLLQQLVLSHVTIPDEKASLRIIDWLGEPGWLISAPRAALPRLFEKLKMAGAEPADIAVWNALRIEAGFPWFGIDITAENLAQEAARTDRCISFRKGCYLGQEPIARIDALGHVNRELRRFSWHGTEVPAVGAPLLDPQMETEIGNITSAAFSVKIPGNIVALGFVRSQFAAKNSPAAISCPSGLMRAQLH